MWLLWCRKEGTVSTWSEVHAVYCLALCSLMLGIRHCIVSIALEGMIVNNFCHISKLFGEGEYVIWTRCCLKGSACWTDWFKIIKWNRSFLSSFFPISRISNQNGVSLLYFMLQIHHSGREPSIWSVKCFCTYIFPGWEKCSWTDIQEIWQKKEKAKLRYSCQLSAAFHATLLWSHHRCRRGSHTMLTFHLPVLSSQTG